jgi:hypothetical protein
VKSRSARLAAGAGIVLGLSLCSLLGWYVLFPEPHPYCPEYVLWKAGVVAFDPALYEAMLRDRGAEDLVLGLSVEAVRARFGGDLRTRGEGNQAQELWLESLPTTVDARWLGESRWLVIFRYDRAIHMRYMKGSAEQGLEIYR